MDEILAHGTWIWSHTKLKLFGQIYRSFFFAQNLGKNEFPVQKPVLQNFEKNEN